MDGKMVRFVYQVCLLVCVFCTAVTNVFDCDFTPCPIEKPYCTPAGCVTQCPDNSFANSTRCVLNCGDGVADENICKDECPAGKNFTVTKILVVGTTFEQVRFCADACDFHLFVYNNTCVSECPVDAMFVVKRECRPVCPDHLHLQIRKKTSKNYTYFECTDVCYGNTPVLKNQTCVSKCDDSEVVFNESCVSECPDGFEYLQRSMIVNIKDKECVKDCGDDFYFGKDCVPYCPVYMLTANISCVLSCPSSTPFTVFKPKGYYTKDTGPDRTQYFYYYQEQPVNLCVAECPMNMLYDNNTCTDTCPAKILNRTCISKCPHSFPFSANHICLQQCPDSTFAMNFTCVLSCSIMSYKNECVSSCPGATFQENNKCVDDCKPNMYYNDIECVSRCPEESYVFNRTCVKTCPTSSPLLENKNCVSECEAYMFYNGEACVSRCPGEGYVFNRTCVKACPTSSPLLENKNCVSECEAYMFYNGEACVSRCPGEGYVFNRTCVKACPTSSLLLENKNCVSECEAYMFYNGEACVSRCPGEGYVFNRTCVKACPPSFSLLESRNCVSECQPNMYYNGEECVSRCPNGNDFIYNKTCVTVCPSDAPIMYDSCKIEFCSSYGNTYHPIRCVHTCPNSLTLNLTCVKQCPKMVNGNQCVEECPKSKQYIEKHSYPSYNECVNKCNDNQVAKDFVCISQYECDQPIIYDGKCLDICPDDLYWVGLSKEAGFCQTVWFFYGAIIVPPILMLVLFVACVKFFRFRPLSCASTLFRYGSKIIGRKSRQKEDGSQPLLEEEDSAADSEGINLVV